MANKAKVNIHWFRRDLRIDDNAALFHALKSKHPILPVFIFDKNILDKLEDKSDKRVNFLFQTLSDLKKKLEILGSTLLIKHGTPSECWKEIIAEFNVDTVFANHDYEPYAKQRDLAIENFLITQGVTFKTFKDQVVFEKNEVLKDDGKPYTVYTPYSRKWMAKLNAFYLKSYPTEKYFSNFFIASEKHKEHISLKKMGFSDSYSNFPGTIVSDVRLKNYSNTRDIPSIDGTSKLGLHLRFGTVSIRKLAAYAQPISFSWLNELCWREFYMMIIWHFPHVANGSFKPIYDTIKWRNNEEEFKCWREGNTGYPIVDAGMRELNATGYMHNRVRMIVASFLTKHLLIDWRWGEAYFAEKLLDFELASNNGGWQWAAGSGCDSAPYFRIFNPYEQTRKFDPDFKYIRKWVPEFEDFSYPQPLVDHKIARERCLSTYKMVLSNKE